MLYGFQVISNIQNPAIAWACRLRTISGKMCTTFGALEI
jgi:hypothetical protein